MTATEIAYELERLSVEWCPERPDYAAAGQLLDEVESAGLATDQELRSARRWLARPSDYSDRYNPWWHLRWGLPLRGLVPGHQYRREEWHPRPVMVE